MKLPSGCETVPSKRGVARIWCKKKKKKFQPTVLENGVRAGRKLEGMGKG